MGNFITEATFSIFDRAGLVVGFEEIKTVKTSKLWIGLVGHFIVVGFFAVAVVYAFTLEKRSKFLK
jgi:hypothetical protein